MSSRRARPQVVVLAILVSFLAFCTGHLWRHGDWQTAVAATGLCLLAVLTAAAIASRSDRRAIRS